MNRYITEHLEDVMFILLDKLSRLKRVDFRKVNNAQVASIIKRIAYDILVTYYYVYDEDKNQVTAYIRNDLSRKTGWIISTGNVTLNTPDGIDISLSVENEEDLNGLVGTINAITPAYENINAKEDINNTHLKVKNDSEEITYNNGVVIISRDGDNYYPEEKITGLNKLISYSRNITDTIQTTNKK